MVTLPKPMTSGAKASGRFGKQDFAYLPDEDVYRCPAGEKLKYYYTNEEDGQKLRNYWTNACKTCPLKSKCTPSPQRRIKRWVHEDVLERAQARLDKNPDAMRTRLLRDNQKPTFSDNQRYISWWKNFARGYGRQVRSRRRRWPERPDCVSDMSDSLGVKVPCAT